MAGVHPSFVALVTALGSQAASAHSREAVCSRNSYVRAGSKWDKRGHAEQAGLCFPPSCGLVTRRIALIGNIPGRRRGDETATTRSSRHTQTHAFIPPRNMRAR